MNQDLATDLDYYRFLRRRNLITKKQFETKKQQILDLQDELDQLQRSIQLEKEFRRREAEQKRKRQEKILIQKQNRQIRRDLIFQDTFTDDFDRTFDNAFARLQNITGTIRIINQGATADGLFNEFLIKDRTLTAKPSTFEDFKKLFRIYEEGIFYNYSVPGSKVLIIRPSQIPIVRLKQMFRDGIEHCVFNPILSKLNENLMNCKSKDSIKKYCQRIETLEDLEFIYSKGVPEDKMEEVAKASGHKIVIHNIIGQQILIFNEKGKLGIFNFTNTRPNHIDIGHLALDKDFEIVSEKEIVKLWNKAMKQKQFYMIEGDIKNNIPRRLRLLDKAYRVKDANEDYFDEMNEIVNLNKYKFNATKYPEVNEFIKAGRIVNSWVCPFSDEKPTGHLDMPKAYSQFKKCSHYSGFLGVIHQWRSGSFDRKFIEDHIGIYRFRVLNCTNPLFQKLGLTFGSRHILPSPEILYFMDKGVQVSIDSGVWGSRFDFEFTDKMLEDRRYCLWSGRLGMERTHKNFSFHSDEDWASHLKSEFGDDCFFWEDKKICSVRVPIKNVMTTHHIFAFITSYTRIQMMEAMSKFNINQLVKVVMDGIYFIGEKPMGLEWFREKEIKENSYGGFQWYENERWIGSFPNLSISNNTLMTGQGGAGKTYKIMTDAGFNKILFVTPQHILGGDVKDKYGVNYTTIHKLIGESCQPYLLDHSYPPVLFIDEITQIESTWIDKVFSMYKDSLIILAGDLNSKGQWFQCRNGRPELFSRIWKPKNVDIVCIEGDRRSRDDKLRNLKLIVREVMEKCFVSGDEGEEYVMRTWARKNLPCVEFNDAVKMFSAGDRWIAGTNKTSDKLLENGIVSGWYHQGGFVSFEEKEGYQKRGSFTIHSFQGRTLETGKIFISINDLFEYAMLYTAISRAVNFDQLVFVV